MLTVVLYMVSVSDNSSMSLDLLYMMFVDSFVCLTIAKTSGDCFSRKN